MRNARPACHASKGLTERTKVMFGSAGFSYVYMVYGMYHCLNIVTEKEGNPAAVLIRSVGVVDGLPRSELPILSFAAQPQSEVLLRTRNIMSGAEDR